jgi:hypothetical protein
MGTGKCHFRFVVKQDIQDIVIVHIVMKESLNSDGHNSTNINKTNNHISPRANIFRLFNFENTVEGIPLLILIYHMDNILTLHLFLLRRGTYVTSQT